MHHTLKRIFICTLLLSTFICGSTFAIGDLQDYSKDDKKKLEKAEDLNNSARELLEEVTNIYVEIEGLQNSEDSEDKKTLKKIEKLQEDIIDKRIDALDLQKQANILEYEVFNAIMPDAKSGVDQNSQVAIEAKLLEEQAMENFYRAEVLRNDAGSVKETAVESLAEAQEFEKLGLEKFKRAYDLYTGAATSDYSSLSSTVSAGIDGVEVNEDIVKNFMNYLENGDVPVSEQIKIMSEDDASLSTQMLSALTVYSEQIESVEDQSMAEVVSDSIHEEKATEVVEDEIAVVNEEEKTGGEISQIEPKPVQKDKYVDENVEYRIEIATDKTPLTQGTLQKLYNSGRDLKVEERDGWQAFIVSGFESFSEAESLKNSLGISNAFIVPVKDEMPKKKEEEIKTEISDRPIAKVEESNLGTGLVFKVQIAADRAPLTESFLSNIYRGNEEIDLVNEAGWYKYSVGKSETYVEAAKLKAAVNVPGAFIVAYKNGKKVPMSVARGRTGVLGAGSVEYKVQIAADRVQIPDERLKEIYKGTELIFVKREEGWYRYSIGSESTLTKAKELLNSCKVDDAFIVAYRNGEKINPFTKVSILSNCYEPTIIRDWPKDGKVIFRIQIAASKKPLSPAELKSIYCRESNVYLMLEDNWYKYSVGSYYNYTEAKKYKLSMDLEGIFIVSYKNGQRLNIKDAIEQIKN